MNNPVLQTIGALYFRLINVGIFPLFGYLKIHPIQCRNTQTIFQITLQKRQIINMILHS